MLLYSRRSLLALPLALAACGFTPVYGVDGTGTKLRGQVFVQEPKTQAGYLITRHLETQLGRGGSDARYGLDLVISLDDDELAIDDNGDTERFDIIGIVEYSLRDNTTGAVVTSGQVENFTGFSTTGTTVSTLASERDAVERLMVILGDQIVTKLYATDLPA